MHVLNLQMFEGAENEAVYFVYNFSLIETDYTLSDVVANDSNFLVRTESCLKLVSVPILSILNFDFFELPDVAVNGSDTPAHTEVCLKLDFVPVLNILDFDFFELIALYGDFP